MIDNILSHTPIWVFAIFAALALLGYVQSKDRSQSLARALAGPCIMVGYSLWGAAHGFAAPALGMGAWLLGAGAAAAAVLAQALPANLTYDAPTRRFQIPGSWLPLALYMGIFTGKYALNVAFALAPAVRASPGLTMACGLVFGLFSGIFAGRTLRLWRLRGAHIRHEMRGDTPIAGPART